MANKQHDWNEPEPAEDGFLKLTCKNCDFSTITRFKYLDEVKAVQSRCEGKPKDHA